MKTVLILLLLTFSCGDDDEVEAQGGSGGTRSDPAACIDYNNCVKRRAEDPCPCIRYGNRVYFGNSFRVCLEAKCINCTDLRKKCSGTSLQTDPEKPMQSIFLGL